MTSPVAPGVTRDGHFAAGDALRAVAALSVFLFHAAFVAGGMTFDNYHGLTRAVVQNLDVGLYLFFVLSGYLIARPFIRAFLVGEKSPNLSPYLRNRFLRIVPIFWAIFALLYLRHIWLPDAYPAGTFATDPTGVAAVVFFAQNYLDIWPPAAFLVAQAWT
ncbi:MAG: acyltransferase family protein, partial [Candidatus Dormibacteraeota bacterium]|nr:acyltransferase family protein [Candidatus Dormibacteraeota bacterium]